MVELSSSIFDFLMVRILALVKKISLLCLVRSWVLSVPPSDLGYCRVNSYSRPVSDGRLEFGFFLPGSLSFITS
jgi:hypothetical protein